MPHAIGSLDASAASYHKRFSLIDTKDAMRRSLAVLKALVKEMQTDDDPALMNAFWL